METISSNVIPIIISGHTLFYTDPKILVHYKYNKYGAHLKTWQLDSFSSDTTKCACIQKYWPSAGQYKFADIQYSCIGKLIPITLQY